MNVLMFLSNCVIPVLIWYVVGLGLMMKLDVFDIFLEGVKDGLKTVAGIVPTLIGLLTAVGVLRAAGVFDGIGQVLHPLLSKISMAPEVLSLIFIKFFSSTAATGLMLDIFTEYGVDSKNGWLAALILCCTESCMYTMSVYYMSQKITKTRWTLAGGLIAAAAGVIVSIVLTGLMY
jgi:spore maturation protein B